MKFFSKNALSLTLVFVGALPAKLSADSYKDEWENVNAEPRNAYDEGISSRNLNEAQNQAAEKLRVKSSTRIRRFHEVLDELFAEFGYDVRMGQLKGLKNLSIRKVEVSDAIPSTYRSYIELLVAERIRENAQIKLISCVACKSKTSRLSEGKMLITSPQTNTAEMKMAAEQLGIDNFMDVVLVYHSTHMVLAAQIFDTSSQELVWARAYNSETIRSRYQKLAIDYSQVAMSKPGEEYNPEYRLMIGLGGAVIPNVNGNFDDSSFASFMVRGAEKFDNRKHEFGLHLSIFLSKTTFISQKSGGSGGETTSEGGLIATDPASELDPFTAAIGLFGTYSYNLIGALESYNEVRHGASLGIGFIMASSYLAGSLRLGWDIFFGKRFVTNIGAIYVLPSKVLVGEDYVDVDGGIGGELGISVNF